MQQKKPITMAAIVPPTAVVRRDQRVTWKSTEKQLQTVKTVSPTVLKVIRLFIGVLAPVMIIVVVVTGL